MKLIYFDPISGISGDMAISALLDAGCPFSVVEETLGALNLDLPEIRAERQARGGLFGTFLKIGDSDIHLSPGRMIEMISALPCEERVRRDAAGILDILIEAESKVHGTPREEVHFHELSSVDTLIDVVSTARAVAHFNPDRVFSGPVPHGRGYISTHHGILPNPPPATAEIMKGMPVVFRDEELELTTPTGAAIIAYYTRQSGRPPSFTPLATGCGFGSRQNGEKPNLTRVFVGSAEGGGSTGEVWVLEADIDDGDMEYMGAVAERIRAAGAFDVLYHPVYMKKGRVGLRLSILSDEPRLESLLDLVFKETTTFGIRMRREGRRTLRREEVVTETGYGSLRIKRGFDSKGNLLRAHLEFDDVRRMADEQGLPFRVLLEALKKEL